METHFIKSGYSAIFGLVGSWASLANISEVLTFVGAILSICSGCLASYHLILAIRMRKRDMMKKD